MISFAGMSTSLALKVADKTRDSQIESIKNGGIYKREIESFRDEVASIQSIDDLVDNYEVFSFVMKSFDLESKIYAKGLMKKVLESDIDDKTSLVNRLNDSNIKALYEELGFSEDGKTNENTGSVIWREMMVERFVETTYINKNGEANEGLGTALKFRDTAADMKNWYAILGDTEMFEFMRTALVLPDSMVSMDIDKQAELLEEKFGLEKLQDPEEIEKLIHRYSIFKDLKTSQAQSYNPISQIMGGGSGEFVPITYDIAAIAGFGSQSGYR